MGIGLSKMPYSSSLTDLEWKIIEPLLPQKQKTRPPSWTKREILDGIFYQLKNGCNWGDLPKDLPPYSTVFWYYKQWRSAGVLDSIRDALHEQVREQAQKNRSGQDCSWLIRKPWRIPAMPVWTRKASVFTNQRMELNVILQLIPWGSPSSPTARKPMSRMMGDWLRCWNSTSSTSSQSLWIFPRSQSS